MGKPFNIQGMVVRGSKNPQLMTIWALQRRKEPAAQQQRLSVLSSQPQHWKLWQGFRGGKDLQHWDHNGDHCYPSAAEVSVLMRRPLMLGIHGGIPRSKHHCCPCCEHQSKCSAVPMLNQHSQDPFLLCTCLRWWKSLTKMIWSISSSGPGRLLGQWGKKAVLLYFLVYQLCQTVEKAHIYNMNDKASCDSSEWCKCLCCQWVCHLKPHRVGRETLCSWELELTNHPFHILAHDLSISSSFILSLVVMFCLCGSFEEAMVTIFL